MDDPGRARSVAGRLAGIAAVIAALLLTWSAIIGPTSIPRDVSARFVDPNQTYDPVVAGETLPNGFRQLLGRDDIQPIYEPVFIKASEVEWDPETLIVGLAIGDDARAYPVNFLNVHEMVNDVVGGTPVLVSW